MRENAGKKTGRILLCAAMGLGLFLALECAVARRAGLDLLLPVRDGRFAAGPLARLAAAIVIVFALGLTERGRKLSAAVDGACDRDRFRWLTAAAVTGLFFLWTLRVTVLTYMTMDEISFLQAIARVPAEGLAAVRNTLSHSAQENASSISVVLCLLIGQLYRLDPEGLWYLGYHLAMLLISLTVIGRCVLVKTRLRRWPVWTGCAIFAALCGGVFLYTFAKLAFTVTAAMAGTASVALVLCRHHETGRTGRVCTDTLSVALIVLCFLQRLATGYCVLCFWALACAYQLLRIRLGDEPGRKRRLTAFCLVGAASLALVAGAFAAGRMECDDEYRQAEYYRSLIGDYLRGELTYEQYARAGIPQELADLLRGWFFMDERINTETFMDLADIYYTDKAAQPLLSRLTGMVTRLAGLLWEDEQMRWQTGCMAALLLACGAGLWQGGRRYWPEGLCGLCAAGGAGLLLLYLVKDGRFLIRSFLVISIPAIVTLLLMALSAPEETAPGKKGAAALAAVSGLALVVFCAMGVYTTPYANQALSREDVFVNQRAIEDYLSANPDKTVVTSIFDQNDVNSDPLHPPVYPENLVQWGYCGDTAKPTAERLYADVFFEDDVAFMADAPTFPLFLLRYLSVDHGPVQAALTARLTGTIQVYELSRVLPPEPDYTGWHEQNGMTYYFRDGQAVTGEQVIDGGKYAFEPAGGEIQFRPATAADGTLIYTTAAYSLIPEG